MVRVTATGPSPPLLVYFFFISAVSSRITPPEHSIATEWLRAIKNTTVAADLSVADVFVLLMLYELPSFKVRHWRFWYQDPPRMLSLHASLTCDDLSQKRVESIFIKKIKTNVLSIKVRALCLRLPLAVLHSACCSRQSSSHFAFFPRRFPETNSRHISQSQQCAQVALFSAACVDRVPHVDQVPRGTKRECGHVLRQQLVLRARLDSRLPLSS